MNGKKLESQVCMRCWRIGHTIDQCYAKTKSNGKKIKYRPFLVREEKILIMALETEDPKQITDAVVQILDSLSCIFSDTFIIVSDFN